MFDKAQYDKTFFDRTSSQQAALYATIIAQYGIDVQKMHAMVDINNTSLNAIASVIVEPLALRVPLLDVVIKVEAGLTAKLFTRVPLREAQIHMETSIIAPAMRTEDSDEILLNGVNLCPGSTLIIDTDTLDITIDNESNVDCWQLGSTFFKLHKGNNELRFYDNASNRSLNVTVLWADRYK